MSEQKNLNEQAAQKIIHRRTTFGVVLSPSQLFVDIVATLNDLTSAKDAVIAEREKRIALLEGQLDDTAQACDRNLWRAESLTRKLEAARAELIEHRKEPLVGEWESHWDRCDELSIISDAAGVFDDAPNVNRGKMTLTDIPTPDQNAVKPDPKYGNEDGSVDRMYDDPPTPDPRQGPCLVHSLSNIAFDVEHSGMDVIVTRVTLLVGDDDIEHTEAIAEIERLRADCRVLANVSERMDDVLAANGLGLSRVDPEYAPALDRALALPVPTKGEGSGT